MESVLKLIAYVYGSWSSYIASFSSYPVTNLGAHVVCPPAQQGDDSLPSAIVKKYSEIHKRINTTEQANHNCYRLEQPNM